MFFKRRFTLAIACLVLASAWPAWAGSGDGAKASSIEHGRYVLQISGCNDCHTPGYAESGGTLPEQRWLTGSPVGWHGPWGTTYAPNLRLFMQTLSEREWLHVAKTTTYRPPMPWFALRRMTDADLVAMYRFIRHLGPAGTAAPAYAPPGTEPVGPVVRFPELPAEGKK